MVMNDAIPTRRECRDVIDGAMRVWPPATPMSDSVCLDGADMDLHYAYEEARKIYARLTDEALAKDEKLGEAHENLFQAVRAMRAMKTRTQQDLVYNELVMPSWEEIRNLNEGKS